MAIRFLQTIRSSSARGFASIQRFATDDPRMSGAVVHGNMVYLSGQVPKEFEAPIKDQVRTTLEKVDELLELTGSNKSNILSAQLWVRSMDDFGAMNEVWNDWVDPENKPARACVEANMARPNILFEAMIVAVKSE